MLDRMDEQQGSFNRLYGVRLLCRLFEHPRLGAEKTIPIEGTKYEVVYRIVCLSPPEIVTFQRRRPKLISRLWKLLFRRREKANA